MKRTLEWLRVVRLVWLTESFEHEGYRTELRIVRTQGPNKEPWCWDLGACQHRARLLRDGTCKCRYRCTWEPYNERSPSEITTREDCEPKKPAADLYEGVA